MAEAVDRGSIPVDGVEFEMVLARKGRDIVEKGARVDAWVGLQVPEDDHGIASVAGAGEEFSEGMPQSRSEDGVPVPDHQDDVRPETIHHMLPTDAVLVQDGVVEILNAGPEVRSGVSEGGLQPSAGEFPGHDRRVEANHPDFVTCGELHSFEALLGRERFVSVAVSIAKTSCRRFLLRGVCPGSRCLFSEGRRRFHHP